jgi:hypothetical protein
LLSAKRRRRLRRRPTRALSSDLMARRSGPPSLTFLQPFSTPLSHPPVEVVVAVEADGPLVVAVIVAAELTAMELLVLTRLPLVRQLKTQSRHLESEDAKILALDVLLPSLLSQDDPQVRMPALQLMHARPPSPPKESAEFATEKTMPPVSR